MLLPLTQQDKQLIDSGKVVVSQFEFSCSGGRSRDVAG
jgi:hypothetical protein